MKNILFVSSHITIRRDQRLVGKMKSEILATDQVSVAILAQASDLRECFQHQSDPIINYQNGVWVFLTSPSSMVLIIRQLYMTVDFIEWFHCTIKQLLLNFMFQRVYSFDPLLAVGSQTAPASLSKFLRFPFLACRSELPPMCCLLMKMLGTVVWPVRSPSVDWIALPSS
jgi:hypothetical protein